MSLYEKHRATIERAIQANRERVFYAHYPENPKAYGEEAPAAGLHAFQTSMNTDFSELHQQQPIRFEGEEVSPYLQTGLGIRYPIFADKVLVARANTAFAQWRKLSIQARAGILMESLEGMKNRFFEIAHATQHTTGQSFMMSFQASGPHAADRALEALAMGYEELTRFPSEAIWDKPMGKFSVTLRKTWKAVPKGISLVIGCSTFPTWNTVPGMYASLITGNPVIVKPHPKAVLPIAIVVAELQKVLVAQGVDPNVCQLAVDSTKFPLAKEFVNHPDIKLIDYTGNSVFGNWLEAQQILGKEVFTEKAGVNPVVIDSAENLKAMADNLAFSLSLYAGQMCTAPQNLFIPAGGIQTAEGHKTYKEVVEALVTAIKGIAEHPKMGPGVLAALQNDATADRVKSIARSGCKVLVDSHAVQNEEFNEARTASPLLLEVEAKDKATYEKELFGPIVMIIKTANTEESLKLAIELTAAHGAISCGVYCTDAASCEAIADSFAEVFVPVSFNLTGPIYLNQHAAFSDFHVTGGNAAGNASFTDPNYVNRRFVWVGQRYPVG
ncbi:MAG: phenylacetic acid degradation protein PaaN [Bacteroidia bacterium]